MLRQDRPQNTTNRATGPQHQDAASLLDYRNAASLWYPPAAVSFAAFMVFPDRTLIEMARTKPVDLYALRTVHGVGYALDDGIDR